MRRGVYKADSIAGVVVEVAQDFAGVGGAALHSDRAHVAVTLQGAVERRAPFMHRPTRTGYSNGTATHQVPVKPSCRNFIASFMSSAFSARARSEFPSPRFIRATISLSTFRSFSNTR
jgi:hypothetical protein